MISTPSSPAYAEQELLACLHSALCDFGQVFGTCGLCNWVGEKDLLRCCSLAEAGGAPRKSLAA